MRQKTAVLLILFFTLSIQVLSQDTVTTKSGLKYLIIQKGNSPFVEKGDEVIIKESTFYSDGELLFSTDQIGGTLKVSAGGNQVIKGLDEGLIGMGQGEIRKLIVPPHLSRRSVYPSNIHPDSTLIYEVKVIKIHSNDK